HACSPKPPRLHPLAPLVFSRLPGTMRIGEPSDTGGQDVSAMTEIPPRASGAAAKMIVDVDLLDRMDAGRYDAAAMAEAASRFACLEESEKEEYLNVWDSSKPSIRSPAWCRRAATKAASCATSTAACSCSGRSLERG